MNSSARVRDDLGYVAGVLRRHDHYRGVPAIYFMWAAITLVGFALPDFAPRSAGPYWLVMGIGGGLLSWWLGVRTARRAGINDHALGQRYARHWVIAGIGYLLAALPLIIGQAPATTGNAAFLLVGGLAYALAGVHLERPLWWIGLLMLLAYVVMVIFQPPYAWTITGAVIALSLAGCGWTAIGSCTPAAS
ncbi:MAG: hypothetical protein J0H50_11890 [Xanthomonadales bacterium]|nr:hypothetical protein [Xanthomonadales bacterium]